jgi:hypothetical protein
MDFVLVQPFVQTPMLFLNDYDFLLFPGVQQSLIVWIVRSECKTFVVLIRVAMRLLHANVFHS